VRVLRGQLGDPLGERAQLLDGLGAGGERLAARLEGERHRDLHADHPRQRLHGVALERRQVVEAIEEHRV
jgi:hypothetical protein